MIAVDLVARIAVEQAVLDHGDGAQTRLFRRLEDQHHAAARGRVGGQMTRHAQQGRRMAVVAAGVRDAGPGRGVGDVAVVVHGQGVHVGAQADGRAGLAPFNDGDHAFAADAALGLETQPFQHVEYQFGGARLLTGQFRVGVDVPPPGGHVSSQGGESRQGRHGVAHPSKKGRRRG